MKNIIIGTAGHIDHGKTTLIRALTGIETDRLKEERKRGITIDLGFAFFEIAKDKRIGIVDVPGHEKFIKNMLAGVSGIDLVLLVVAADEGFMPQTQEHLDILSILDVKKGIIVLTKCDLVDDEWLDLVTSDIDNRVKGTFLENSPIIKVSATEGKGLNLLKEKIIEMTEGLEDKDSNGPLRLPIDRVFTMSGFGTVVTGTLIEGSIEEKQTLYIYPAGIEVKVRNIQVHGESVKKAYAGQRVAVNLHGVKKEEITRGDILADKDTLKNTMIIDVKLNLLKTSKRTIENWTRLRLYHGTKEVLCRAVLLDKEVLNPGETCFAQLRLEEITACKYGDRFVVRYYSPLETIGGGVILDPNATKHKRFSNEVINDLVAKQEGDKGEIIERFLMKNSFKYPTIKSITLQSSINEEEVKEALEELEKKGLVIKFSNEVFLHSEYIKELENKIIDFLKRYHKNKPLKQGILKEEIRSRFFSSIKGKLFDEILEYFIFKNSIKVVNNHVSIKDFKIQFSKKDSIIRDNIIKIYKESKYKPPSKEDIEKKFGSVSNDIIEILINEGILIKISDEVILYKEHYEHAKDTLIDYLKDKKEITISEYRDLLNTSRKYVVPIMEYFDMIKLTKRIEDKRILL